MIDFSFICSKLSRVSPFSIERTYNVCVCVYVCENITLHQMPTNEAEIQADRDPGNNAS